ncbi:hypothetical protein FE257_002913 [Aspergillus nanangensis]|uniref:Uncharacterized protein n=1 Tax=Aspergillus nanangensis TaxID=2582783 RepID=A0AAD4CSL8_ASPNN|nr:hypothetical protein FE257_002913 [Aspergillus nanangensis]
MDSMRSLNTSLPSSTPRTQPPEQLLQSFKAAALSVTHLYKNAVYEQAQAKQVGYQEAIEDLLHFLDKENLGLGDGEGWKVRQWATERSDGTAAPSDDDEGEKQTRSTAPSVPRKEQADSQPPPRPTPKPTPTDDSAPQNPNSTPPNPSVTDASSFDQPAVFTFTAGPTFPSSHEPDVDMQPSDTSTTSAVDGAPVSVSVLPRNPRQQSRHNNLTRPSARSSTRESPVGMGSKRKFTVPDFFDLSGMGNRDVFGGGKRGRFT